MDLAYDLTTGPTYMLIFQPKKDPLCQNAKQVNPQKKIYNLSSKGALPKILKWSVSEIIIIYGDGMLTQVEHKSSTKKVINRHVPLQLGICSSIDSYVQFSRSDKVSNCAENTRGKLDLSLHLTPQC